MRWQRVAKVHWSLPVVVLLLIVGGGLWWLSRKAKLSDQAFLEAAIEAVAAAENGKYDRALTLWDELLESKPGDPELLLNQSVTVLKWIDERSGDLSSGLVSDPVEQEKLRGELTQAFAKGRVRNRSHRQTPQQRCPNDILTSHFLRSQIAAGSSAR